MAKVRIYEEAKKLGVQPNELIKMLQSIGITGKVPSSSIEETAARSLEQMIANRNNPQPVVEEAPAPAPAPTPTFQKFRPEEFRARHETKVDTTEVASDHIEDFREATEIAEGVVVQGPAKSGPGARRNIPAAPVARTTPTPPARPASPPPARPGAPGASPAPSGNGASAPVGTGASGASNGAAPAAPAGGTSYGNRGGRDFRGGGSRNGRGGRGGRNGRRDFRAGGRGNRFDVEDDVPQKPAKGTVMTVTPDITVAELAELMMESPSTLIKKLFLMNIVRSANQALNTDVAGQLLAQFGYGMEVQTSRQEQAIEAELEGADMVSVPPVVTVMGHVDHGKTSLLDTIRSANVQTGEAGGITQRIGAYETEHNGHRIVFLDTPGHEAFTRMRARGAHVTDIAILVVAADDGVMPQTREAMDHARAAKVPIIVAMNKMDKPDADPNHVKAQLAENGLIPEDYGGDTVVLPVSAKTGMGVQELLDMVLLVAEMQELKAIEDGFAEGTVIEARQDPQRGPVATVLLHRGTLKTGDHVVVGDVYGRVRAMQDYKGDLLETAGPKTPISLLGLSAVPHASDTLRSVGSAREAREQALAFGEDTKTARQIGRSRASLEDFFAQLKKGSVKEMNMIVKADGQGSVEALCQSLEKLAHDEVRVKVISRSVGNVTESDVMLAAASDAIIIGFAVGTESTAASLADREKIQIRTYSVIYDALNDVKAALEGMLKPIFEERETGEAEVRATFKSAKAGVIAGCMVMKGKIYAGSIMRVFRKDKKVYEGKIDSLRHVKSTVKEMTAGQECGISSNAWDGFEEGDRIVGVVMEQIKRTIDD